MNNSKKVLDLSTSRKRLIIQINLWNMFAWAEKNETKVGITNIWSVEHHNHIQNISDFQETQALCNIFIIQNLDLKVLCTSKILGDEIKILDNSWRKAFHDDEREVQNIWKIYLIHFRGNFVWIIKSIPRNKNLEGLIIIQQ
jgi:hypothetical protein